MRVLMSIMVFHPVIGGTEQSAKTLAAYLVSKGHQVEVLTLRQPGQPQVETLEGIRVHRCLRGAGRGLVFVMSYAGSLAWCLLRRRKQFDVLQVHFAYLDALVASMLRPWLHGGVVLRLGGGGPAGDLARLRRLGVDRVFLPWIRRLDCVVVVSEQMRQELLNAGFDHGRVAVIPNGVDTRRFASANGHAAGTQAITVARLSEEKGVDVLLDAWKGVVAKLPHARLLIVGHGPLRASLQRQVDEAGLNGTVRFLGELPDVLPDLQASDVFVLPSRSEGLPNALLQAMAAGLPCVATRVGGVSELIEDRVNGRLVAPEQVEELAEALVWMFQNPLEAARYRTAARYTVEARFTLERMAESYLSVYKEVA